MTTNILPATIASLTLTLAAASSASAEAPARYRQVSYNAPSSIEARSAVWTPRPASATFVAPSERPIVLLIDPNLASYQGGGDAPRWMSARPTPFGASTIPARPHVWPAASSAMQDDLNGLKLR